jgi:hypothetical protein
MFDATTVRQPRKANRCDHHHHLDDHNVQVRARLADAGRGRVLRPDGQPIHFPVFQSPTLEGSLVMTPELTRLQAELAKARGDFLFAQLSYNLCQARQVAYRIAEIEFLIQAEAAIS